MAEDGRDETRDKPRERAKLKVTDRRMFTADGELREDFRHLREQPAAEAPVSEGGADTAAAPAADPEGTPRAAAAAEPAPPPPAEEPKGGARVEMPHTPGSLGTPGFMELVGVLAEPIAIYLGDAQMPDGSTAENPEAARFYIDLLEVLKMKTAGNLSVQESTILEDLLYQLRMRYVRKRG